MLKSLALEGEDSQFVARYIKQEFPLMYKRMIEYILNGKLPYSIIQGPYSTFREQLVKDILSLMDFDASEEPFVINNLIKIQKITQIQVFSFELIRCFFMYQNVDALKKKKRNEIVDAIKNLEERKTRELLLEEFETFKKAVLDSATTGEVGSDYIASIVEEQLSQIYKQLSTYDC